MGFGDQSTGRGTFGGEFETRYCNQWGLYGVHMRQRCEPAMQPSSQITLGRLVGTAVSLIVWRPLV